MKLSDLNQQIKSIKADEDTKEALMKIIDLKIENDMEKVLNQISMIKWIISGIGFAVLLAVAKYIFFSK